MKTVMMKAKDLCKSFANNGGQNHVLDMVGLEIYEGDFTVIMGSSGAGKSTLLYVLSGMDKPTGGEVYYRERRISHLKEKEMAALRAGEFGFVFQQAHLVSNLTLLENVTVAGYLNKHKSGKEIKQRAEELLTRMNVEKAMHRLPSQVSGGEAQRAAIARAMIHEPGLLFADEPTGNLDSRTSSDVMGLLKRTSQEFDQTIVMITHNNEIAQLADRIVRIEDGRIVE